MEFSCAAESANEGTPADNIESKQIESPASTATICYVVDFSTKSFSIGILQYLHLLALRDDFPLFWDVAFILEYHLFPGSLYIEGFWSNI
jgi:hypothetical protein